MKTFLEEFSFSSIAGLRLWIHAQIFFSKFGNFGGIFFQLALVGCFFRKECQANKNFFRNYCIFQEIWRRDIFQRRMKYLYGKYYLAYAGISPRTSGIPPSKKGMKTVQVSYKLNKTYSSLLVSFIVPSRLLYKQPLSLYFFKTLIKAIVNLFS